MVQGTLRSMRIKFTNDMQRTPLLNEGKRTYRGVTIFGTECCSLLASKIVQTILARKITVKFFYIARENSYVLHVLQLGQQVFYSYLFTIAARTEGICGKPR